MSNEIQKRDIELNGRGLALRTLEDMARFADGVIKAGLAPRSLETREKLIIAMELGQEIGLPYMIALKSIAVIQNVPTIYGDAALGLVKRSGLLEGISEEINGEINGDLAQTADHVIAVCTVTRKGEQPTSRSFSVADAKRARLWNKTGPWQTHPKRMMQYKARAFALRDTFPDVLMGLHFFEEMDGEHGIKQVESTDVTCRSQALLDEAKDGKPQGDDRNPVPQPREEEREQPEHDGPDNDPGDDVPSGGVDETEPESGEVPESESPAAADEQDSAGNGSVPIAKPGSGVFPDDTVCVCKVCKRQFPHKLRVEGEIGDECPFCGNLNWDASTKPKNEIWKCSKGHTFPMAEVVVTPLSRTGKCPTCPEPNIKIEKAS